MESLPRVDLTGRPFGRFVVVGFHGRDDHGNALWLCKCSCGQSVPVVGYNLTNGASTNCGCKRKETVSALRLKHGHSLGPGKISPEYRSWFNAKTRVGNPKFKGWHRYGGRGLAMSKEWSSNFATFLRDMGLKPTPRHTLERVDNNRGYEKGNCVWALPPQQQRNRSTNIWLEFNGRRMVLKDWAKELGRTEYWLSRRVRLGRTMADIIAEQAA